MTINVKSAPYSAAGNGITTDTAALQSALDAAAVDGQSVLFPPGMYLSDTLNLYPHVPIVGESKESSIIKTRCPDCTLLNYSATSVVSGFDVRDITLDAGGMSNVTLLKLDGTASNIRVSNIHINNVHFNGTAKKGLHLRYAAGVNVADCTATNNIDAYNIDNCTDTNLRDSFAVLGSGIGFNMLGTPDNNINEVITLTGCVTKGQGKGVRAQYVDSVNVSNCSFTETTGIVMDLITCVNWAISNSTFIPTNTNIQGVVSNDCGAIRFVNNRIEGCNFGLSIANGRYWNIANNFIAGGSNVDIFIAAGYFDWSNIIGNFCGSVGVPWSIHGAFATPWSGIVSNNIVDGAIVGWSPANIVNNNLQF